MGKGSKASRLKKSNKSKVAKKQQKTQGNKPQKPIWLLDLGSGPEVAHAGFIAKRLKDKSDKRIVAVDLSFDKNAAKGLKNLELIRDNAVNYLRKIPPASVQRINIEFLLSLMGPAGQRMAKGIKEVPRSTESEFRMRMEDAIDRRKNTIKLIKEAYRALKPGGVITIIDTFDAAANIEDAMKELRFSRIGARPMKIEQLMKMKSEAAQGWADAIRNEPSLEFVTFMPLQEIVKSMEHRKGLNKIEKEYLEISKKELKKGSILPWKIIAIKPKK